MSRKKQGHIKPTSTFKFANDKIKIEGLKRKRRRMRLKARTGNEAVIEKFSAQSCKTAKYAKTVVKKREQSEMKPNTASGGDPAANNLAFSTNDNQSNAGNSTTGAGGASIAN